jgi:hypothetical protein
MTKFNNLKDVLKRLSITKPIVFLIWMYLGNLLRSNLNSMIFIDSNYIFLIIRSIIPKASGDDTNQKR